MSRTQRGDFLLIWCQGPTASLEWKPVEDKKAYKWLLVQRAAIKTIKLDNSNETGNEDG